MKKLFSLLILTLAFIGCEPKEANAQNLGYSFENGFMILTRTTGTTVRRIGSYNVIGLSVDTVQIPSTGYDSTYLDIKNNGIRQVRLVYA